jgi:hypothetical protein
MGKRILLGLLMLAWVTPLPARGPVSSWPARGHAKSDCPNNRAKAAAARQGGGGGGRPTTAPLSIPGEGSWFALGRGSSVLVP